MKKAASVLTSALVLALAAPIVSAAPVDVTGKVETQFEMKYENNQWTRGNEIEAKIAPVVNVGDNVRFGLEFATEGEQSIDAERTMSLGHTKTWLQVNGPFWNGGPEMTTTIGDQSIKWNSWVGHLGDARAVAVEGIDLAVADADVFYAWTEQGNPMGVRIGSEIDGIELDGMLVYQGGDMNAAVGAATNFEGIDVDGTVAMDADRNYAFKVNAAMSPMENVTLKAGYRQMQDGFNPLHAERKGDQDQYIAPFHKSSRANGFNVGVETMHAGFVLGAAYDQPTETATLSAARTFDFEGHAIKTEYEATLTRGEAVQHEVSASTTTDLIPFVSGLGLNAKLTAEGTNIGYEVGAEYNAPNGISLGADYSSEKGATIHGGLEVSF